MNSSIPLAPFPSFPKPIYQAQNSHALPATLHMKFIDKVHVLISPRGPAFPGYSQPSGNNNDSQPNP